MSPTSAAITIKPTSWRGVKFRSRLEARWAVFFDRVGIVWEYEPECFRLSSGELYIPDFRLDGRHYAEVKPPGGDFSKAETFARDQPRTIIFLEGSPGTSPDGCYRCSGYFECTCEECLSLPYREGPHDLVACVDEWVFIGLGDCDPRFYWSWGGGREATAHIYDGAIEINIAIGAALSERFGT